jgi:hypothetical protein
MYVGAYLRCCVVRWSLFHGAMLGTISRMAKLYSLKNFMDIINFHYTLVSIRVSEGKRVKKNFRVGWGWADFTT